jgi:hypothetical protein
VLVVVVMSSLESLAQSLVNENRILKRMLDKAQSELKMYKPVFYSTRRNERRAVHGVIEKLRPCLQSMNVEVLKTGLKIGQVVLVDDDSETNVEVTYSNASASMIFTTEEALLFKDRMMMSDDLYKEMVVNLLHRVKCPSQNAVEYLRVKMNKELLVAKKIRKLDDKTFVLDFREQLKHKLELFVKRYPEIELNVVRIKLTADGTNFGKAKNVTNMAFMLVDDAENVMSVSGVNLIGVTEWSENYEDLQGFFAHLDQQIRENPEIEIFGKKYVIDFYFCADMKMICIVLGLYGPQSKFPSFVCHANKFERWNCTESDKRNHELAASHIGRANHAGYKHQSLLPSLPWMKFVMDPLHRDLRIEGRMIFATVKDLADLDGYKGGEIKGTCSFRNTLGH